MRKRFFRACCAVSAAGVTVALGLGAAGASASVAMHRTHHSTPMCAAYGIANAKCTTWLVDNGSPATEVTSLGLMATGAFVNAPVVLTGNDTSDPMMDFIVTRLGTVTNYWNAGFNDIGLNAYDNAEYGNDELVSIEFAPGGVPTDLNLANVNDKLVLRQANGLRWQTFIEATSVQYNCFSNTTEIVAAAENDTLTGPGGMTPLGIAVPTGNVGTQAFLGGPGSLADTGGTAYDCDADGGAGAANVAPFVYTMLLSCAHVFDNGQHLAMNGTLVDNSQVTFWHPVQSNDEFWAYAV